jgi:hypothetical protein
MGLISLALRLEFREFCVGGLALKQIDSLFTYAGIQPSVAPSKLNISGERRTRVEEFYASIDWSDLEDAQKFLQVLETVLSQTYISVESKNAIREMCIQDGLIVEGNQVKFSQEGNQTEKDLFKEQFPVGLPFGKLKPNFAITAGAGRQSLKFELESGIGIIWKDVYPCFDFDSFQTVCGISPTTNLALKNALVNMNQTDSEKEFFKTYAKYFEMADKHVPMLVPQAWIQWHSMTKRDLRSIKSSHADELYRVDFVVFWENKRYAILIDDISHYAIKRGKQWLADEESYSNRLKEDRRLVSEGWYVFRLSNWEMRDSQKVKELLIDVQRFIGF